ADMTFAVSLSAASGRTVTVPYTLGGTASAPADYAAPDPASVEIAAGGTAADIVVPIKGDVIDEGNETVTVTLGAPTNATVLTAEGAGTITDDDDAPTGIALSVDVTSIEEGAAETEVTVTASTGGTTFATAKTVRVTVGGGASTATSGTDYTAVQPFGIVLNAGTSSATAAFDLEPLQDNADELDETIEVTGSESGGATVDAATITLTDDDKTTVALGRSGSGGIAENGGSVEVTVTLGRALVAGESVTVPLAVTGTAVTTHHTLALKTPAGTGVTFSASAPHSAQNPAVTLAGAGARTATLVLTAVANADFESRAVSIGYGTGARKPTSTGLSGGINAKGSLSVPIIDDDAMVSVAAASAAEGSAVAFTVTLPKPAPAGGVTVAYSTSNGRGESTDAAYQIADSADYTAAAEGTTLTIAQGDSSGEIRIATTQDDTYEGDHHFRLTLTGTSHFNLGAATAVGTIEDDADAPVFAFTAASTAAAENAGTVTLTVERTGTTLVDATVSYSTKDGTATGGSDFTAIAATSLEFKVADTSKAITVAVTDDGDDEPAEAFTVELADPSDATLGAQKSHSVAITDNDKTAVTLSAPSGDISESGGSKVITVTLGRALSGTETLAVPLAFSGAAKFGTDYTLAQPNPAPTGVTYTSLASTNLTNSPPTITFSGIDSAASSATLTLSARADSTDEGAAESVTVGAGTIATAPDGGAAATGTAAFNITDDDAAPGGIKLAVDTATIAEDAATATVTVTATVTGGTAYAAETTVRVEVGADDDSATETDDYAAVAGFDITIPAMETSARKTFSLDPVDDSLDEDAETISVAGTSGSIAVTGASIEITDDDDPPTLSIDAPSVAEGGDGETPALRFTV
ncbi:MAG: hypothetical protein F4158_02090, partial [Synechococcus sp. SB0675_bin_7]|nr:hypothetical protein [Synechococcus sp. SB0675_bin_7]